MSKFFVEKIYIAQNEIYIYNKEDIKHISKVLRKKVTDTLDITDGSDMEYTAEITEINSDVIVAKIIDMQRFGREPDILVTLFQAVPKQSKMEVIVQKCVELGVSDIIPFFSERTVVTYNESFKNKVIRWQKIAKESVKQCRRGKIPKVHDGIDFKKMLLLLKEFECVLFPYENEENVTIKNILRGKKDARNVPKNVAVIIGSEGGFSENEAKAIIDNAGISVCLGKTILRAETAGAACLAMIMYEFEM